MCASIRTGSLTSCSHSCGPTSSPSGGPNVVPRRRSVGGAVRGARARRTHARAVRRSDRGACARLQHGVPPRRAARDRRLQSRSTCAPATTWTSAGGCRRAAGRSGSRRRRSSGITTAPSIGAYWRQQVGYGEGEVWLQPHHPDKFVGSRIQWRGHVYSPLPFVRSLFGTRVNAGPWGTAPFPSVYQIDASPLFFAPHSLTWQARRAGADSSPGCCSGQHQRRRGSGHGGDGRRAARARGDASPGACATRSPRTSGRCRRCRGDRRRSRGC